MRMNRGGRVATIVGVVCSAELVIAAAVGGAGVGSLVGWRTAFFATLAFVPTAAVLRRRSRTKHAPGLDAAVPDE